MDKYYIPSIEEFYTGFEYEEEVIIYTDKGWFTHKGLGWEKRIFDSTDYMENYYLSERVKRGLVNKYNPTIRVKYLDKEDIESLGFKHDTNTEKYLSFNKDNLWLQLTTVFETTKLAIKDNETFLFIGIIKNKSELIKLLKQLGINNNE